MNRKVLLKDIADYVGVSTALVSYVINNKEKEARVGVEIAKKIRKAAIKLNYQPNFIAKSLKSGRTNTIGLIVADISNPFFSNIARIIEDEARKLGYVVIFGSSDESAEKSQGLIDVFLNRQVDAFIIAPAEHTENQIKKLKSRIPVVLIDRYFPSIETDCVRIDNFQAAYHAVAHLIKNGRKKIAMMAYDIDLQHIIERKNGYKEALKKNGIKFNPAWLLEATFENIEKDVEKAMTNILSPRLKVDALFFATNTLAVAGLKIINQLGIKVPDDLAIVSFDESDAFDFFYSPLTYVSQSLSEIGRGAVKLATDRINNGEKKCTSIVVQPRLILRKSSV
ncbi:MAG: substrate-binding domain-containing protein [Bacteroidetes bacterium]|nr:substrate-binding domain-containing protein [Bacteroidota bacterium]